MTELLVDHLEADRRAREQISRELDRSLFVEAGAGTGKTRALVDRYVALLASGVPVERLVAITFTERAAAELRDRVRGELEHRTSLQPEDHVLAEALAGLDRAQISTIHAFCATVLRTFAAESGIDPAFTMLDDVQSRRRFDAGWVTWLESLGNDEIAQRVFGRVLELGLYTSDIEKLAYEIWRNPGLALRLDREPVAMPEVVWPDLTELLQQLRELEVDRVPAGDVLRSGVLVLRQILELLIDTPAEHRHIRLMSELAASDIRAHQGQKKNWSNPGGIERARSVVRGCKDQLQCALDGLRNQALCQLLRYIVRFARDDIDSRLRSGELVFDDLILQVREVLAANPAARRRFRARYDALLIDEFQDTDPTQTDIALFFAQDPDTGRFDDGRLFLVGDPKQSIYRFRRADMVVYARTRELLQANGGIETQLDLNRRSQDSVLEFVNRVFERMIGVGQQPTLQPRYVPIHAHRNSRLAGPGVLLLGGQREQPARDIRALEAAQIAAWCRTARGSWEVAERRGDGEHTRYARYGDIAILLPTRTSLPSLERALGNAGVPYRVEGGSLVYATQEVRDLLNCLAAIDDPTDEVAVVGALRSPAYGCSDVELARHKLDGGSFDYLESVTSREVTEARGLHPGTGKVVDALQDLRRFHDLRGHISLATMTESFISAHRVVEAGLFTSGTRDAFRRARFIIEQARRFEAEQPESLRAFVEWLSDRADDAIMDHEGAGLDDDEDAVRVLTIHAAKGLEFPIVFLSGLGVSPSNVPPTSMVNRESEAVTLCIGSASRSNRCTVGDFDEAWRMEQEHQSAERARLLYVAATRARDHFVVSLYHSAKARNTHAQALIEARVLDHAPIGEELDAVMTESVTPFSGLELDLVPQSEEQFLAERQALAAAARGKPVTSATGLGALLKRHVADTELEREDETEPWARGRAGTHRGRAVHAALQVLPWDAGADEITALAQAQAVAETIPNQADAVSTLLERALQTRAADRARAAARSFREVPFAFTEAGVLLEGFIDLLIESGDGRLEIVDWKTDAIAPEAIEQRLEEYRLQAGLYVLALEQATGRKVADVTYVFIAPEREVSPGEPAELARYAREEIARFAAAGG